ncbi:hypothetical protein ACFS07_10895 [Undibacterium arcticum]
MVDAVTILAKHASRHTLHVKTLAGDYKPLRMTLLPGQIVPASGERDAGVCIDLDSHRDDGDLLRKLEATEIPLPGRDQQYTPWFNGYLHAAIIEFCARLQKAAARPRWDLLSFGEYLTAGPLDPLTVLSEEGRVRMTLALVPHLTNERSWVLRHQTRPEVLPTVGVRTADPMDAAKAWTPIHVPRNKGHTARREFYVGSMEPNPASSHA